MLDCRLHFQTLLVERYLDLSDCGKDVALVLSLTVPMPQKQKCSQGLEITNAIMKKLYVSSQLLVSDKSLWTK